MGAGGGGGGATNNVSIHANLIGHIARTGELVGGTGAMPTGPTFKDGGDKVSLIWPP